VAAQPTVVFFPEGAYGPTNNCVGIGQQLLRRGVRVVFVIEESFAGNLAAQGFEERLMRLGPPSATEEAPGQFWKDFIRETAPEFRKPTIEQLASFIVPTFQALVDGSKYVNARIEEIIDELQPDVVCEDNVVSFPALPARARRWVRIASCNPAELFDEDVPPVFSGYAVSDRSAWEPFWGEYERLTTDLWGDFDAFCRDNGAGGLPSRRAFMHSSPDLNLYLYPAEADYARRVPLDATWHRLDSCVRSTDETFAIPAHLRGPDGKLVYLSLGSLGSADVELMQRLVDVLGETRHRVIVSMGPQHDLITLHDNMWGAEFVPQPAILPQVDLVITHAGNNTTTECFHHGKPMIALPLFWDQYDNAQRIDELGLGTRLDTYRFTPEQLTAAIDRLTTDGRLARRLAEMSTRLQASPGTVKAADLIERLARG
jgi:MGT family glycosyltransferase